MPKQILAAIDGYKSLKNGSTRFYLDIDKTKMIQFFTEIGIPNGDDPIPVYITSAEYPPEGN